MIRRAFKVLSLKKIFDGQLEGKNDIELAEEEWQVMEHLFTSVHEVVKQAYDLMENVIKQYRCEYCRYLSIPGLNILCECEESED